MSTSMSMSMSMSTAVQALPHALGGERIEWQTPAGRVSAYRSGPGKDSAVRHPPLVLVHSVNAAGCAFEVLPLYDHYRHTREVVALDLPGFGFSERSDRAYTPRLMTDALLAVVGIVRAQHGGGPVDVLGVSLASEFVARAALEAPDAIRRIALVSPTGFSGTKRRYGPPGSTLGIAWLHRQFSRPLWVNGLYNSLTRPGVIRYFLERTWGSKKIDEALWRYDVITTRQPGARYAPLYFLSAFLFSKDINTVYEALDCPVWVSMATRGDFTDYRGRSTVDQRANWHFVAIEGGALPYFETPGLFFAQLDPFWD